MRLQPSLSPYYCCLGLLAYLTCLYVVCSVSVLQHMVGEDRQVSMHLCFAQLNISQHIILPTRTLDTENTDFITSFFFLM